MTFCKGTEWEATIHSIALVYSTGTTWEILAGMPVVNHHSINLWPCAFLGGVVMFPRLANANYEHILSLPPSERCKHLGAMVVLLAATTEYDNGQGAFAASALVAAVATPPLSPILTPSAPPLYTPSPSSISSATGTL